MSNGNESGDAVGVQELIDRLKTDGVSRGQEEAEKLLAEARKQAMKLVDDAKNQAETILSDARQEADSLKENGEKALRLAGRDAALTLREQFQSEFRHRLSALVGDSMRDPDLIKRLILEIAGKATEGTGDQSMQLLVPAGRDQGTGDPLADLARSIGTDMLREGVTLDVDPTAETGVRVKLEDQDVIIDMTEQTVTDLLMRFVAPRFRAVIDSKH